MFGNIMQHGKKKLMPYSRLRLSASAYFYRYGKGKPKDFRKLVGPLFEKIKKEKKIRITSILIRAVNKIPKVEGCSKCRVSALCFRYKSKVPFIADDAKETKYAYLCIVDFDGFIVISKKNIVLPASFMEELTPVPAQTLSECLLTNASRFESIATTNMARSDSAIRGKSYTARDLAVSLPNIGNNTYALNRMRIFNAKKKERSSLHLTTSRISQSNQSKEEFKDYLIWAAKMRDIIEGAPQDDASSKPTTCSFIENFAKTTAYKDNGEDLTPKACLILPEHIAAIQEGLESTRTTVSDNCELLEQIKGKTNEVFMLSPGAEKDTYVGNWYSYNLKVKKQGGAIKLLSEKLGKVMFAPDKDAPDDRISILQYLNAENCFVVYFDNSTKCYYNKNLYEDSNLLGNIKRYESILKDDVDAQYCMEEKRLNADADMFCDSLFAWVEEKCKDDYDYLILEDMGPEWADYIGIGDGKISLFHLKAKSKAKTKAEDKAKDKSEETGPLQISALHEVISQAQKNIGLLRPNEDLLKRHEKKWKRDWQGKEGFTRLRRGKNIDDAVELWQKNNYDINTSYEVHIATNSLSRKAALDTLMKAQNSSEPPVNALHLAWLLSGLLSACLEQNAKLFIHCI